MNIHINTDMDTNVAILPKNWHEKAYLKNDGRGR